MPTFCVPWPGKRTATSRCASGVSVLRGRAHAPSDDARRGGQGGGGTRRRRRGAGVAHQALEAEASSAALAALSASSAFFRSSFSLKKASARIRHSSMYVLSYGDLPATTEGRARTRWLVPDGRRLVCAAARLAAP